MILTEAEAKTKWCRHVRTGLTAGMAVNHHVGGDVHDETRCIATGCMAWRWMYSPESEEVEPRGYCGDAGRPSP